MSQLYLVVWKNNETNQLSLNIMNQAQFQFEMGGGYNEFPNCPCETEEEHDSRDPELHDVITSKAKWIKRSDLPNLIGKPTELLNAQLFADSLLDEETDMFSDDSILVLKVDFFS